MAEIKTKPEQVPSLSAIQLAASGQERDEIGIVIRAFREKTFVGRLVTNWCGKCGRWRLHYISSSIEPSETDTFNCSACGAAIRLLVDGHVVLDNGSA